MRWRLADLSVNDFRQMIRERVSSDALLLVIGYIEAASKELTAEMIYADDTDKTLRLQGQVRGHEDMVRAFRRMHERA